VFNRNNDKLTISISSKLSGKQCIVEEGCDYFESVVIPGIADNNMRESAKLSRKL
jgi:hypothetical protein